MSDTIERGSISIVVAVCNGEAYLEEAIRSAQSQTREAFELIVVDDGSTDRSAEIARDLGTKVIQQANGGLPSARNTGLRASHGDYIVFLDDDDRMLPENLAVNAGHLDSNPDLGFVGGRSVTIRSDGTRFRNMGSSGPLVECSYKTLLEGNAFVPPSSVMFRRSTLQTIGAFDEGLRIGNEDLDVYLKIARLGPVLRHSAILVEYRRHDNNLSSNSLNLLSSVRTLLDAQIEHCKGDPDLLAAIEHGKRHWVAIYGPGLVGNAIGDLRNGKTKRAFRGVTLALQLYPSGFIQYVSSKVFGAGCAKPR